MDQTASLSQNTKIEILFALKHFTSSARKNIKCRKWLLLHNKPVNNIAQDFAADNLIVSLQILNQRNIRS